MSHPNREEWMAFLYEDLENAEKLRLAGHLASCEACKRQVSAWRGTMANLNQWRLAEPKRSRMIAPMFRWAAAATILLASGIAIGAASRSSQDVASIQKAIEPQIRASVLAEVKSQLEKTAIDNAQTQATLAKLTKAVSDQRAAQRELASTVQVMEQQRLNDRKDLETVAVSANDQLYRLASYIGDNDPRRR